MMGIFFHAPEARTLRQNSYPSIPGIMISRMNKSGMDVSRLFRASSAEEKQAIAYPSSRRLICMISCMSFSSSMTNIFFGMACLTMIDGAILLIGVPDVNPFNIINRPLGNIGHMVADTLQRFGYHNETQGLRYVMSVLGHVR